MSLGFFIIQILREKVQKMLLKKKEKRVKQWDLKLGDVE